MNYKKQLVKHLQDQYITCISDLWAHSKDFFRRKCIEMGGGYCTWNKFITVTIRVDDRFKRFNVCLDECQPSDIKQKEIWVAGVLNG